MALEKEDVKLLTYPFPAKAHKFANDMPYIHEEIINDRLDMVDPNWELKINRVERRANAGEGGKDVGTVWVHVTMTVKGVSRDEIGMAVIQQTNPNEIKRWNDNTKKNEGTGQFYTSEANEAEKSATTDALKRAARKFGVGRYLLAIPKVNSKSTVTNVTQMEKWLKDTFGEVRELSLYYDDSDGSLFGDNEEIPAPAPASNLEPESHGLHKLDRKLLNELTAPLYDNAKHQENSINKLLSEGVLKPDMNADTAAAYVFKHCAGGKELGFNDTDIKNALGMTLGEYLKQNPRQYAKAWQALHDYANTEMSA